MRVHLVDGTFELFRAHYSKRPSHSSPTGKPLKATVGVVQSLLFLLHEAAEAPTHVAVAFDNPVESFRNDLWEGYKTGAGVDPELLAQFDEVEEAVRALGVVVWSMKDHEADDALATAAAKLRDRVEQVRILTPDKDLGQCLRGRTVVQIDRLRSREITEETLRASLKIAPTSVPDWLALTGDTADGIPGVPGFGAVSASTLLSVYEHLENIPDDPRAWKVKLRGAERLSATLVEHREASLLWRKLATLVDDLPLFSSVDELAWRGVPRERFAEWCAKVGAESLRDRPSRWAP